MRGRFVPPKPAPPHGWFTWIQHDESSFIWPSRSQWNWTRTRPNSSTWISSPAGPTTVALSTPCARGLGVFSSGRYGESPLTASRAWLHLPGSSPERVEASTSRGFWAPSSLFGWSRNVSTWPGAGSTVLLLKLTWRVVARCASRRRLARPSPSDSSARYFPLSSAWGVASPLSLSKRKAPGT